LWREEVLRSEGMGRPKTKDKQESVLGLNLAEGEEVKAEVISKLIKHYLGKIDKDEAKASLGDFLRLVQLRREMESDEPKEVKVTWVEPSEKESVSKE